MGSSQSSIRPPAVELISHWHLNLKDRVIFDSGTTEITQYFNAVDKIIHSAHRDELQEFISMIVARFKSEFHIVLTRQTESAMGSTSLTELSTSISDSTSYQFRYEDYVLYDAPRSHVVDYLVRVVEMTNDCGHLKVLTEVYVSVRKQFVDWIIKKLRFEELLAGNTKKFLGEDLKMKTERWVQAAKICFKLLFTREKQIAKQIFGGFGNSIADESFMHIVKDVMFNLLKFPENVISSKLTFEKLEIVLILCNALLSIAPDVNALFQFESGQRARNTIEKILSRLQDEVRRMLSDFVNGVFNDTSKIVDKAEAVLPFTKYVMSYLNHLVNHKILLMNVIVTGPLVPIGSLNFMDDVLQETGNLSPLSLHLVLIIAVLLLNLEAKGKKYKNENPLFGYELFMLNNIQFIVQKITGSEDLQEMVGPDYLKKLKNNLNNTMDQFQALDCDNLLNCLKEEELYVSGCFCRREVSTQSLRRQMKKFNSICENMDAVQSSEIIQDTSMREELCRLTKEMLVPAYARFLDKFKNHLNFQNNSKSGVMSFRKVVVKRAHSMAQAAWSRPSLRLSSWSCVGPRRRATSVKVDSDDVIVSSSAEKEASEPFLEASVTAAFEGSELPVSSSPVSDEISGDSGDDEEEDDMEHHGQEDSMTEVELWQQLEHELYNQADSQEADVVKEIRKEEAAAIAEVNDGETETNNNSLPNEAHRFFPPGRLMHIVPLITNDTDNPNDDDDDDDDDEAYSCTSEHSSTSGIEVGIFLTPRSLYSKLRLSQTMISDHLMHVYRRQLEKLIEQLKESVLCN